MDAIIKEKVSKSIGRWCWKSARFFCFFVHLKKQFEHPVFNFGRNRSWHQDLIMEKV